MNVNLKVDRRCVINRKFKFKPLEVLLHELFRKPRETIDGSGLLKFNPL